MECCQLVGISPAGSPGHSGRALRGPVRQTGRHRHQYTVLKAVRLVQPGLLAVRPCLHVHPCHTSPG